MKRVIKNLLLMTMIAATSAVVAAGPIVRSIVSDDFSKAQLRTIVSILGIQQGSPLNERRIDQGIKKLADEGMVQSIYVERESVSGGVRILVRGDRQKILRSIKFLEGVETDIADEVTARAKIKAGTPVDSSLLAELRKSLKQSYEDRGFYSAKIEVEVRETGKSEIDLIIRVTQGVVATVRSIEISGATQQETESIKEALTLKIGSPFNNDVLEESVEEINAYLKASQLLTSKVEQTVPTFTSDRSEVDLIFFVRVGKQFQFEFRGNSVFHEVQLRELMTAEVLSQVNAATRISELIEQKYKSVGFHFAQVKVEELFSKEEDTITIKFDITEGERVLVDRIELTGDEEIVSPDGILERGDISQLFFLGAPGVLKDKVYWQQGVPQAIRSFQNTLVIYGYLSARVEVNKTIFTTDKEGVVLFLSIDLGTRTVVSGVQLEGTKAFAESELKEIFGLQVGEPLNQEKIRNGKQLIVEHYRRNGYVDAAVEGGEQGDDDLSRDQENVLVEMKVTEGVQYYVGKISVSGNKKTKNKVIEREILVKEGEVYNPERIRESEEAVALLGLFSRVEILSKDSEKKNHKDLEVVVGETDPGFGEIGLGGVYTFPRFRLRTLFGIGYRNLQGLNQTVSFRGELLLPMSSKRIVEFVEYITLFGYRAPYPFDLPLTFNAQIGVDSFEVRTSPQQFQTRARIEGKIEKRFSKSFIGLYRLYSLELTTTETRSEDVIRKETDRIGSTGPGMILDFRDDAYNPRKGSYHTLDLEFAHPALLADSDISFLMALSRNSFYLPLFSPFSLVTYAGFGYAESLFRDQNLPEARLLTDLSLGGLGSIRGFDVREFSPDATTTRKTAYYNFRVELWTRLFPKINLVTFFDTGQIFPNLTATSLGRHDGVGIGFRYETPVGPVAVDIGVGLEEGGKGRFYFTVGSI